jgi:hypothetical protein
VLAAPLAASLGLAGAAALMAVLGVQHSQRQRWLGVGVEVVVPLVAALPVAWMIAREPALELQLSLPRPYPGTVGRRLAIALAWSGLLCLAIAGLLWAPGWWRLPNGFWSAQLTWLSPLAFLLAAATLVVLLVRSPSAAGGLIAVLWLVEIVLSGGLLSSRLLRNLELFATTFAGPAAPFWLSNRLLLCAMALLMLALAARLLDRPELLLAAAHEEPT